MQGAYPKQTGNLDHDIKLKLDMTIPHSTTSWSNLYIKYKQNLYALHYKVRRVVFEPKGTQESPEFTEQIPWTQSRKFSGAQWVGTQLMTVILRHCQRDTAWEHHKNKGGFTWEAGDGS